MVHNVDPTQNSCLPFEPRPTIQNIYCGSQEILPDGPDPCIGEAHVSTGSYLLTVGPDVYRSVHLSVYLAIYLSFYILVHPSTCPSIHPCIYLCIYLSVYPSIYLSVYLSVCLSTDLSTYMYILVPCIFLSVRAYSKAG